jgi:hypothetical protein
MIRALSHVCLWFLRGMLSFPLLVAMLISLGGLMALAPLEDWLEERAV